MTLRIAYDSVLSAYDSARRKLRHCAARYQRLLAPTVSAGDVLLARLDSGRLKLRRVEGRMIPQDVIPREEGIRALPGYAQPWYQHDIDQSWTRMENI